MKADHITHVLKDLHWLRIQEKNQYKYVYLRSSFNIVWHQPTCQTNFNKSLEWSPNSV